MAFANVSLQVLFLTKACITNTTNKRLDLQVDSFHMAAQALFYIELLTPGEYFTTCLTCSTVI